MMFMYARMDSIHPAAGLCARAVVLKGLSGMALSDPTSASSGVSMARILRPRAIAIVGASADPRSFGGFVQGNLERYGYSGELHLVSRSSSEINGHACVKTIDELPEGLDLAVLAIPEAGVLDAVQSLAARQCHAAVLFASGYAEAGEEGQAKQVELARVAREAGIALVGPNCMGLIVPHHRLALCSSVVLDTQS